MEGLVVNELAYWLKGEKDQNFGDYLTEYLVDHLFLRTARDASQIRLIGSFLHNWHIDGAAKQAESNQVRRLRTNLVAWGGGIRERGGLSPENQKLVEILSVRGPVSASELRLGAEIPLGDPALLLPALYGPVGREKFSGKSICVPHFNDRRSDHELLEISRADLVLRPNIEGSNEAIEAFINALCSASFVLSSSLHAAIVAAAYARPFAFWDPGFLDVPLKWQDFAESVGISTVFVTTVTDGVEHYEGNILPRIRLPSMWGALAVAPYLLRPDALLKIVRRESAQVHDLNIMRAELDAKISLFMQRSSHFDAIASESLGLVDASWRREDEVRERMKETASLLRERDARIGALLQEVSQAASRANRFAQVVLDRDTRIRELEQTVLNRGKSVEALEHQVGLTRQEAVSAQGIIAELRRQEHLACRRAADALGAIDELRRQEQLARQDAADAHGVIYEMRRSRSWRLTRPYRAIGAAIKKPFKALAASGILFRSALALLLFLPATVYCGGFRKVFSTWRRVPNFAATVLGAESEIREQLLRRSRWFRRLTFLSYSLGRRVFLAGSVSRAVRNALRIMRTEGLGGVLTRIYETVPRADSPASPFAAEFTGGDMEIGGAQDQAAIARRVLVLDYRVPRGDTSSGELATVGILRDLVALGYEVVFAPTDMAPSPKYETELRGYGVEVITSACGFESMAQYVERHAARFGVFYIVRIDVAENTLVWMRSKAPSARVIFHASDLHFLRGTREAQIFTDPAMVARAEETLRHELAMMRQSDHVAIVRPAELPVLRRELSQAKPVSVFSALYAPIVDEPRGFAERRNIFFLGGFGHAPNISAVHWFVNEVWPLIRAALPEVMFRIVGADAPDTVVALGQIPGVEVVGFVEDLQPVLESHRVGVAPLFYGAGIKGKLAMSMGAGIPCVCTEIAAEGMDIENNVHSLIENQAQRFAEAVILLYEDEVLWSRLSRKGQELVRARFSDAANRGSLLKVLNEARALPIPLFQAFCENSRSTSIPSLAPETPVEVTIIVPVFNKWSRTRACLTSIVQASSGRGLSYEVILADEGSTDDTMRARELVPGLRVIRSSSGVGFLSNCNHATQHARGQHILLLSNETIVLPGWLEALYRTMNLDPSIAIVGSKLLYPSGRIQEAGGGLLSTGDGVTIGRWLFNGSVPSPVERDEPVFNFERETDFLSGACVLIRGLFWREVGGFDERYGDTHCGSADLAMKARTRGFRVVYEPASEVVHFERQGHAGEPAAPAIKLERPNKGLLMEKWGQILARDHLPAGSDWHLVAARGERTIPPSTLARRKSSGSRNILYFSPFPSHPSNHGNQATIQQFGKRFQMLGHRVHFALLQSGIFDTDAQRAMAEAWDTFDILPNSRPLWADGSPISYDGWYQDGLGEHIRALCARYDIDVVFCSYVFQSKMLEYVPSHVLRVIDTHDKMGGRYDMLRARGLPVEFFSCTLEEEGAYLRRADVVIARREEEANYFNQVTGTNSSLVVPHFEAPRFADRRFRSLRRVAIVASANRINLSIVQEFLHAIDTALERRECPFIVAIAGQVRDMVPMLPEEDSAFFRRPWVRLLGFVSDIEGFYGEADLVVSPVTIGTGINVKTVQAMAYGMPLLSTELGSKGIETDEPLHRLDNPDSLARELLRLVDEPAELDRLAAVSRTAYQRFFDASQLAIQNLFATVPHVTPGDFSPFFMTSHDAWNSGVDRAARFAAQSEIERHIQAAGGSILIRAQCCLCGVVRMSCAHQPDSARTATRRPLVNWSESLVCSGCGLNSRMRAATHLIFNNAAISPESTVHIMEKSTSLFHAIRSRLPKLTGSEFPGDRCALGSEVSGVQNEDLTRLPFEDASQDAVLSFDVLEHIPNYRDALREVFRCLRPGGVFIATALFDPDSLDTTIRAEINPDGDVRRILPHKYNGDPINSEQRILCFQSFGWDMLEEMRHVGFVNVAIVDCWSLVFGYLGDVLAIVAAKPGTAAAEFFKFGNASIQQNVGLRPPESFQWEQRAMTRQ